MQAPPTGVPSSKGLELEQELGRGAQACGLSSLGAPVHSCGGSSAVRGWLRCDLGLALH